VETVMLVIDEALFRRPGKVNKRAIEHAIARQTGMPVVISDEP
jgi:hypothetical protein